MNIYLVFSPTALGLFTDCSTRPVFGPFGETVSLYINDGDFSVRLLQVMFTQVTVFISESLNQLFN